MYTLMYLQTSCVTECFITKFRAIWTFSSMYTLMYFQIFQLHASQHHTLRFWMSDLPVLQTMAYGQMRYSHGGVTNSNPTSLGIRDVVGVNYEEAYEADRQHFATARGRSSTRPSTGGRCTYNIRRN